MSSCCGINRHNKEKKGKLASVIGILLAMLTIAALFHYANTGRLSWLNQGEAQAAVAPVATGNEVAFPEAAFADGKARFFDYKTPDGKRIRYFVIKSSDGVIRAAFDACDVCWEAGRGYFQQDDFMVCRNCGRRFQSAKVNVVTGGCNPSALTRTIRGGKVVIPVQALNEGRRLFS